MIYLLVLVASLLVSCSHTLPEVESANGWQTLYCVKKAEKSLEPLPWQYRHCVNLAKREAIVKENLEFQDRVDACQEQLK